MTRRASLGTPKIRNDDAAVLQVTLRGKNTHHRAFRHVLNEGLAFVQI